MRLRYASILLFSLISAAWCSSAQVAGGQAQPSKTGEALLQSTCSDCHTLDVITRQKKTRAEWTAVVADMVSRGAQGSPDDLNEVVEYLSVNFGPAATAAANTAPAKPAHAESAKAVLSAEQTEKAQNLVRGNGCLSCHRLGDSGSYAGPDLNDIGSHRTVEQLRAALVSPDATAPSRSRAVRIVTREGKTIEGKLLNQDLYSLQLLDFSGQLEAFPKSQIRELTDIRPDPMPSYAGKITDADLSDLVDYLATLKGTGAVQNGQGGEAATTGTELKTGVTFERILKASGEPQNWLTFNGSYQSQHYSLLNQITPANAKNLELKWIFQARWLDSYEATPLVADGVLYTLQGDDVVALDAATGRLFWIYRYTPVPDASLCCGRISRGLAILGSAVYLATVDSHLIAIDAKTGDALWNTTVAKAASGYSMTLAPLAIKNEVLVGVAGGEYGIRGFIAAFDARTGSEIWRFNTTAGPDDPGNNTWGGDSWKHGGGPIWLTGSYDQEANLTYWGVGNAGPDFNGDIRPGDNLYTCSMIALDPDTGKLKWYYQANPHNEFDWDAVQVPVLANINWHGQPRKVMLWANRNGFFYVLDRMTGEFLRGTPFVKQNWNAGFDKNGRPTMAPGTKSSTEGTVIFPDVQGGTNWFSPSFSPRTGLFYVNARENSSTTFRKGEEEYKEGNSYLGLGRGPAGRTQRPASAADDEKFTAVRALDPHTGEKKWEFKLNSGVSLHTSDNWNTSSGAGGILTTASDVLFTGGR